MWSARLLLLIGALLAACVSSPVGPGDDDDDVGDDDAGDDDDDATDCIPTSCAAEFADCGTLEDGCGTELQCGECDDCGTGGFANRCGCPTVGAAERLTMRFRPVNAFIDVLLDGAAPTGTATDHGTFLLEALPDGGGVGFPSVRRPAWDPIAEAVLPSVPLTVLPGRYTVHYRRTGDDDGSPWPRNTQSLVGTLDATSDGGRLTVNLVAREHPLVLTVGGEPLVDLLPYPQDGPPLFVELVSGSDSVSVLRLGGGDPPQVSQSLRLFPGGYVARYANAAGSQGPSDATGFPLGSMGGVSVSVSQDEAPIVLDIPVADWTIAVTLDGEMPSVSTLGPDDAAALAIAVTGSGSALQLPELWDGTPRSSLTVRVVPGTWDVYFDSRRPHDAPAEGSAQWPWNTGVLAEQVVVGDGTITDVDVTAVTVQVELSLGGQPPDDSLDEPRFVLASDGRTRWLLPAMYAEGLPTAPYSVRLLPGDYMVSYQNGEDPDATDSNMLIGERGSMSWPLAWTPVPLGMWAVWGDGTQTLDPDPVCVSVVTRVEGVVPDASTKATGRPRVQAALADGGFGDFGWMGRPQGAIDGGNGTICLPAGDYRWAYRGVDVGWPDPHRSLPAQPPLQSDTNLSFDLEAVGFDFVFDGPTVRASDHPRLYFIRAEPRATFAMLTPWDEATGAEAVQRLVLPRGDFWMVHYPARLQYDVVLDDQPLDALWPLAAGQRVGCLTVE